MISFLSFSAGFFLGRRDIGFASRNFLLFCLARSQKIAYGRIAVTHWRMFSLSLFLSLTLLLCLSHSRWHALAHKLIFSRHLFSETLFLTHSISCLSVISQLTHPLSLSLFLSRTLTHSTHSLSPFLAVVLTCFTHPNAWLLVFNVSRKPFRIGAWRRLGWNEYNC